MSIASRTRSVLRSSIVALAVLALGISGCSGEDGSIAAGNVGEEAAPTTAAPTTTESVGSDTTAAANRTRSRDGVSGVSIEHPKDWSTATYENTFAILIDPASSSFRRNLTVVVQATTFALGDYTKQSDAQVKRLANYQLFESKATKIDGIPAQKQIWQGDFNGLTNKLLSMWVIKDGKAYIFTYTSDVERFQEKLADAEAAFATIDLP